MNKVFLCLGSNIDPKINLDLAFKLLKKEVDILSCSQIWETAAVGSSGPNFLNQVVLISTNLSAVEIKENVIEKIEKKLGRIRTKDKNSPRTIDLDIIIFNQEIIEEDIWSEAYIALPLSEIYPDLVRQGSEKTLKVIAQNLAVNSSNKIYR